MRAIVTVLCTASLASSGCIKKNNVSSTKDLAAGRGSARNIALIMTGTDEEIRQENLETMTRVFGSSKFGFEVMSGHDQTAEEIRAKTAEAARSVGEDGTLVWYLNTHGNRQGTISTSGRGNGGRFGHMNIRDVVAAARGARTTPIRRAFFIIDTCESGGMVGSVSLNDAPSASGQSQDNAGNNDLAEDPSKAPTRDEPLPGIAKDAGIGNEGDVGPELAAAIEEVTDHNSSLRLDGETDTGDGTPVGGTYQNRASDAVSFREVLVLSSSRAEQNSNRGLLPRTFERVMGAVPNDVTVQQFLEQLRTSMSSQQVPQFRAIPAGAILREKLFAGTGTIAPATPSPTTAPPAAGTAASGSGATMPSISGSSASVPAVVPPVASGSEKCQCGLIQNRYGKTCAVVRPQSQWNGPTGKFLVESGGNSTCTSAQACSQNYGDYVNSTSWCPKGFDFVGTAAAAATAGQTPPAVQPIAASGSGGGGGAQAEKCRCGLWNTSYGRTCAVTRPGSQWSAGKFLVQSSANFTCGSQQACEQNYGAYLRSPTWCPAGFLMGNE